MGARVTATMLADLVRCEERVRLDLHGEPGNRQSVSGFVKMFWSQGNRHEDLVIERLEGLVVDLRGSPIADRVSFTAETMQSDADWILRARLVSGDLEGRPDLLHRVDGVWFAGDIESGSAWEANGASPRLEYGVQVGLYGLLLERLGLGDGHLAFVIGSDGEPAWYDLHAPFGRDARTIASCVISLLAQARAIRDGTVATRPALSSACGLRVWKAVCKARLMDTDDLTLIPGLGRSVRTQIEELAGSVTNLAELDIMSVTLSGGRTTIKGVSAGRLTTFRERARTLQAARQVRVDRGRHARPQDRRRGSGGARFG